MNNEWILDILTDLRSFALQNDLEALAEQLDQTRLLAAVELSSLSANAIPSDSEADKVESSANPRKFATPTSE
ncbi:hypothetical protein [Roseovarius pelagicus]|uniref:Uncharacterized protein n=1 Tax=Roseovarius pelagicus TaxID=2980108 RepID=A0ABY6DFH6_9RHOB|nr:hypothetical protein [Roseovarius pelagicus]UXX84922.1 hypothetical protein N7U68_09880 [Roseovarius pelagicus]